MVNDAFTFDMKLLDIHMKQLRLQALHDPASSAHKMGMVLVMVGLAHAIPEGPVSSRKALNQPLVYKQVKDAIKGDLIDGRPDLDGCHYLGCCQWPRLLSN
jgi:hypothetical protein